MSDGYQLKSPWDTDQRAETQGYHLRRTEVESLRKGWSDAADHVVKQRYELEALRAENAELKERLRSAEWCRDYQAERRADKVEDIITIRAEVERLTKERDEARKHILASGAVLTADATLEIENDALRARVQKLEGALKKILEVEGGDAAGDGWIIRVARAALESGTGPIDPIGPIEKPIAPAPKTFTVEEVERAFNAWNGTCWVAFRRALGLGEP